jgi:hypothetical protein
VRVKKKGETHFICNHGNSSACWADRLSKHEYFIDQQDLDTRQSCSGLEQETAVDVLPGLHSAC